MLPELVDYLRKRPCLVVVGAGTKTRFETGLLYARVRTSLEVCRGFIYQFDRLS